ncbi:hypothetical protein NCC49_006020 [Naganishia albida]|nr:hypothetical protein NCC49_006020 [Naganishia albida]
MYIALPTLHSTTWSPSSLPPAHLPIPEPATTEEECRAFFEETTSKIAIESQRSDRTIALLTKHIEEHGRVRPNTLPESVMVGALLSHLEVRELTAPFLVQPYDRIASPERIAQLYGKCEGKIRGLCLLGHNPAKGTQAVIRPATDSALVVDLGFVV